MALTELQLLGRIDFYQQIQTISTEIKQKMLRWGEVSAFINMLGTEDLDTMGVPSSGSLRSDLVDLKVTLNELISLFEGNTVTPTKSPKVVVDKLRKMIVT